MTRPRVHPGPSAYNRGCRCDDCKRLHTERQQRIKADLKAKSAGHPELIPHGTIGGYTNWLCRCDACTAVSTAASAAKRERRRAGRGYPCCEHCEHDPGYVHVRACSSCGTLPDGQPRVITATFDHSGNRARNIGAS